MPLAPAALEPLLRLALVPGVGPSRLARLLSRFGSAERVLGTAAAELAALPGFGLELAQRLAAAGGREAERNARRAVELMQACGAVALTPGDLAYPDAFRRLTDAPYLVFASGRLDLLPTSGVGIVGTRAPTVYGRRSARDLAGGLARAGYTVVSGMARGIDAEAHEGALAAGGGTIGVLGTGIERCYPPDNRDLFRRMREDGLLVSEFVPGEEPRAGNFPRRNRLIAALSDGVLVVEMGYKSGAQHTVTYALDLGKDVFAVPGEIGSPSSAGSNRLLKEGARLVTSVDDILEELNGVGSVPAASEPRRTPPELPKEDIAPPVSLSTDEARVYASVPAEPSHVDDVAAGAQLGTGHVLAALLGLELRGLVVSLPGKRFQRS